MGGLMMEVVEDILLPSFQHPAPVVKGGIVRSQKAPDQADKLLPGFLFCLNPVDPLQLFPAPVLLS